MLARFSVKKPFTVLVAVIIVLVLGGVSLSFMKTNLLPNFEIPYLLVITTDVGASPERVQEDVTEPIEGSVGTVSGVTSVTSNSAENYSIIMLEFEDSTDMDSALVKVSAAVNEVASELPESAGTPTYMEMSMDMIASVYLGVSSDTLDISELSEYVEEEVVPELERKEGVADVTTAGSVEDTVSVKLNQNKIDNVNDGILGETNGQLAKAAQKLDDAAAQLKRSKRKLAKAQKQLNKQKAKATEGFASAELQLNTALANKAVYESQLQSLSAQLALTQDPVQQAAVQAQIDQIQAVVDQLTAATGSYEQASAQQQSTLLTLAEAQNQLDDGLAQITTARTQLKESRATYKQQRDAARDASNIDAMLAPSTLVQLIQAQNLEAPAGYVDDDSGDQWMLKVGEEYTSIKELRSMVLTHIDGLGDVTLDDVADVVALDNVGEGYCKHNGDDGIILSISKTSTANTGDVSSAVAEAVASLSADNPDVQFVSLVDQGDYVDLYVGTILQSLLIGALLAVVVLAVFLRNVRPTLVVAFSIPFSVLLSLVIMYFWGLDLNIMTLGAMSLSIGMLVDNSIVVMENIYRLRSRGLSPTRAAAQGALQVTGAIVASTLTTVCVFFPFVFTTGTVRQLMVPFALTIAFVLLSSLLVALSVVPALGSRVFKNKPKPDPKWFTALKNGYGRALEACLNHKAPVLVLALALLVGSCVAVVNMGITLMPSMTSNTLSLTVKMPDDMSEADAYDVMDIVGERVLALDGISDVGVADGSTTGSTMTSAFSGASSYSGSFMVYGIVDSSIIHTEAQMQALIDQTDTMFSDLNVEVTNSNNVMSSMSELMGDVEVDVTASDNATAVELSEQVMKKMKAIDGYSEIENGQEDADPTLHLVFDKDKVARLGTTVAQIYQQISAGLSDEADAVTLHKNGNSREVSVDASTIDPLTKENLLGMEFTVSSTDTSGTSGTQTKTYKLSKVAMLEEEPGVKTVQRIDSNYTVSVTATVDDGYNITLLARELQPALDQIELPAGASISMTGTTETINQMLQQMLMCALLGALLIYLIMVAQFQSLLAPFIIILTVPLAFTGGLGAMLIAGEQLNIMTLLGFIILMGTIVNNGIVFVDYVNQLRLGGVPLRPALVATGKTRMRPILMTALTTVFAMLAMVASQEIGSSMERGMAIVVVGGMVYGTLMTLFVVPVMYEIMSKRPLKPVDLGSDTDLPPDDAGEVCASLMRDPSTPLRSARDDEKGDGSGITSSAIPSEAEDEHAPSVIPSEAPEDAPPPVIPSEAPEDAPPPVILSEGCAAAEVEGSPNDSRKSDAQNKVLPLAGEAAGDTKNNVLPLAGGAVAANAATEGVNASTDGPEGGDAQ